MGVDVDTQVVVHQYDVHTDHVLFVGIEVFHIVLLESTGAMQTKFWMLFVVDHRDGLLLEMGVGVDVGGGVGVFVIVGHAISVNVFSCCIVVVLNVPLVLARELDDAGDTGTTAVLFVVFVVLVGIFLSFHAVLCHHHMTEPHIGPNGIACNHATLLLGNV